MDRALADQAITADPDIVRALRALRSFLRRVVSVCLDHGIDQFLDLGSGIPTVGSVHELARRRVPGARVAYVDCDPVTVCHSEELLRGIDGVTVTYADLRDVEAVLSVPEVAETLDFDRPVAVLLLGVLHFVPGDIGSVVAGYREQLVPGSAMAVSHASLDWADSGVVTAMQRRLEQYRTTEAPLIVRDHRTLSGLLDGLTLLEPGLVEITAWRSDTVVPPLVTGYVGALALGE